MSDTIHAAEEGLMLEHDRGIAEATPRFNTHELYEGEMARFRASREKSRRDPWTVIERIATGADAFRMPQVADPRSRDFSILDTLRRLQDPIKIREPLLENNIRRRDDYILPCLLGDDDKYSSRSKYTGLSGNLTGLSDDLIYRYLQLSATGDPEARAKMRKIDWMSKALGGHVDAKEVDKLIANDEYVEFIATALDEGLLQREARLVPLSQSLSAMAETGTLQALLTLSRSGFAFDQNVRTNIFWYLSGQQVYLPQVWSNVTTPAVKRFVQNPELQEFAAFLADAIGGKLSMDLLTEMPARYNLEDIHRSKEDAIFIMRLLYGEKGESQPGPEIGTVASILRNPDLVDTFTSNQFLDFVDRIKTELGYKPTRTDFYHGRGSTLADLYHDGRWEDMKQVITTLYGQPGTSQRRPELSTVAAIMKQPDLLETITDPQFTDFVGRFKSQFGYTPLTNEFFNGTEAGRLVTTYRNAELRERLLQDSTHSVLAELSHLGYRFRLEDIDRLQPLFDPAEAERLANTLNAFSEHILGKKNFIGFSLDLLPDLRRLAAVPGIEARLQEVSNLPGGYGLETADGLKFFLRLGGDVGLYSHANILMHDDYFSNIRDAQRRLSNFKYTLTKGEISDAAVAKIFSVATKPTELDKIALKMMINAEIASVAGRTGELDTLLQASDFRGASELLTQQMVGLAIPVIYKDLDGEALDSKQKQIYELSKTDPEFETVLEIACRSVGIYGQKFPDRGDKLNVLLKGIRQALELNIERNPRQYLQNRLEASGELFDRVFGDIDTQVREEALGMWQDLSHHRRLRVNGDMITPEEATLSRLHNLRDVVRVDLADHLSSLFMAKLNELRKESDREGGSQVAMEQRAIFEQYLLTPDGQLRRDLPLVYRQLETFVRDAQKALKTAEIPKAEKAKLGRSLGTYSAISDTVRALYRLHNISETRYKARKDYVGEVDKEVQELSSGLKRLKMVDPEKRSTDVTLRALEEQVIQDIQNLKDTMAEENIEGQTIFETETTVNFRHLAEAPDITQSCQRLTEVTGQNDAAYSRLLDGVNEMVDIFETRNGQRVRLARSFIELSKFRVEGEERPAPVVLLDREYVNPQYQNFSMQFSQEMIGHLLDRLAAAPHVGLLFSPSRFTINPETERLFKEKGYVVNQVNGEYFVNQSTVPLTKYYDSVGGKMDVYKPYYYPSRGFYLATKVE